MKRILLLACIFSFLVLVNLSQAVEVDVVPSHAGTYVNEKARYTIEIYNDKYRTEEFVITVLGPHLEWLNLGRYYVKMGSYENKEVEMYFYPKLENSYEYEILVYSETDNENRDSDTISLKVLPERLVRLLGFSSEKVGNNLEVRLELSSKYNRDVEIQFEVIDGNGKRVKYLEITKEVDGTGDAEEIGETIPIGDLLAGSYEVKMNIPEHNLMDDTNFYIPPVHRVVKKKEVISTPFGQEIIITIKNEGNMIEDYTVKESVPANQYVDLTDNPTSSYLEEGNVNYNWRIEGFMVGGVEKVTYNISRIPYIIGSLVVIFCVLALLGMGTIKVRRPNIKKRYVRKRGEHLVVLEIKGSLTKEIRNVLVKDRISPLGKVSHEFEGPEPIVREGEAGTELIWRLGDVRPRSEIYLTYRIRPLIEAQLKMPRAYLTYRTEDERKIKVFSKQLVLD
ncbi:MAG: hypothetical protein V3U72_04695 [Candidatus Aenigmarchaeota archaeon]